MSRGDSHGRVVSWQCGGLFSVGRGHAATRPVSAGIHRRRHVVGFPLDDTVKRHPPLAREKYPQPEKCNHIGYARPSPRKEGVDNGIRGGSAERCVGSVSRTRSGIRYSATPIHHTRAEPAALDGKRLI